MDAPGGIDDATLKAIIERASRYQLTRKSRSSAAEVIAIAEELGIAEDVVRRAMRDVQAEREASRRARRPKLIAATVLIISLLCALAMMDEETPPLPAPEASPQPTVAVPPSPETKPPSRAPKPKPKVTGQRTAPITITGSAKLTESAIQGTWRLKSYQMAMDGRSVEVPLRHDPQGLHADRETWTLRTDGTFTHRFSASLWFSGKWRLGGVAEIPDPLRPSKDLAIVHLITEEVTTSMMKQRPIEHYLISLTGGKEFITWYAGQTRPTLKTLQQGHRFERVNP